MIASITPEALGTILAAIVAGVTGVGAYLTNRRTRRAEAVARATAAELEQTNKTAELNAAEVTGWKLLIETLTAQYATAAAEAGDLRGRLADGNKRFETISEALMQARERLAVQDERIAVQDGRIAILRDEVARLGGDVDAINRHGKQGPPGDQGARGVQGAPGVPGVPAGP